MALVQSIIDSLAAIASGDVGFVAQAVENAMASAVPVLIGFLASLLGIDGLADKVQDIIQGIRKRIDDAITGLIDKAKDWFKNRRTTQDKQTEGEGDTENKEEEDPYKKGPDNRTPEEQHRDFNLAMKDGIAAIKVEDATESDIIIGVDQVLHRYNMDKCEAFIWKRNENTDIWLLRAGLGESGGMQKVERPKVIEKSRNDDQIGDGEVGETIHFSADGHDHRLWFNTGGNDVELMLASNPTPLGSKLNDWTGKLNTITDETKQKEAKSLLSQAVRLSLSADEKGSLALSRKKALEDWLDKNRNNGESAALEQQFIAADDTAEVALQALVRVLERLFVLFGETDDAEERMPGYMSSVSGYTAHHVIPHSLRGHSALDGLGVNVSAPENMIYLPNVRATDPNRSTHPVRGEHLESGQKFHEVFHGDYINAVRTWLVAFDAVANRMSWTTAEKLSRIQNLQSSIKRILDGKNIARVNDVRISNLPPIR